MHPLEVLIAWLIASDFIWAAAVALYLAVALPISFIILKRRDKK